MISLNSYNDFKKETKDLTGFWVLIYKKNSKQSDCAYKNINEAANGYSVFTVDVNDVKDIHTKYDVKTVPTLLKFENKEFKGVYKGCNDVNYYKSLFEDTLFSASRNEDAPKQKNVVVYSTPTCSWCNRIKDYFKANNIRFRDIDVSKNQKAAEEMVKRSGQQGVPQTLIGGQIIIGFDKPKIDKLLGL